MNIDRPPRVRLEWLIATARVVIASSGFVTFAFARFSAPGHEALDVALGCYVIYSLLVLGLVWAPAGFAQGWDIAVHLFDLIAFSVLLLLTAAESSPFYLYFIFLVICGTLRWQWWGALWTALAAVVVYCAGSWYAVSVLGATRFDWDALIIRSVNVGVVAMLVGYLGAYQHRHQREVGQLVSWPRKIPGDDAALIAEILSESGKILQAPRTVLAWEDPDECWLNMAWLDAGEVVRLREKDVAFDALIAPNFNSESLFAADAADPDGVVIFGTGDTFKQRKGRPIHAMLQRRFDMHAVRSWAIVGEIVRGRLFCLDTQQTRVDDLTFGQVVARQAGSRLDSLHLLKRLRDTAALEERLRLARELHDSLVQSVAGSALKLLAARRQLNREPEAARQQLEEVQMLLERGELEMRSFIGRLRPPRLVAPVVGSTLPSRLEELRKRVERDWSVKVKMQIAAGADAWPDAVANEVYRLAQEAVLNAARHADASAIKVVVTTAGGPCLEVIDDGCGFPFRGTFDLRALNEMNAGPLTLKERVGSLNGDLFIRSSDTGTGLLIRLPAENASV